MHVPADADYAQTVADRAEARSAAAREVREAVADVREIDAAGVPGRLYVPIGRETEAPFADGLIVHLHGGGFVFNDVEVHDAPSRRLANRTGRTVLSVDYRLAPEYPYPAAVHDVDRALRWAVQQTDRIVLHGDSAGGNLAIVGALRNPGLAVAVVLVYPFVDPTSSFGSYETNGPGEDGWTRADAQWLWDQYLPPDVDRDHPDIAPAQSDQLSTLPPTLILTAGNDVARDEGEDLLELIRSAGGDVSGCRFLGLPHGFWRAGYLDQSDLAMWHTARFLNRVMTNE